MEPCRSRISRAQRRRPVLPRDLRRHRRPDPAAPAAGALQSCAVPGLLPEAFAIVGVDAREHGRRRLPRRTRRGAASSSPTRQRRSPTIVASVCSRRLRYVTATSTIRPTYEQARHDARRDRDASDEHARQSPLLSRDAAALFAPIVAPARRSRAARARTDGAGAGVIVEKPFGTDLASAQALNRELLGVLDETQIYRIDHYPRQGDGPEHHGAALRQRHVRAALEPRSHRPRADHRRRDGRRRAPRQLLRRDRRAARHGAEPPVPAAVADRDGAADLASSADAVRNEKAKVLDAVHRS